MYCINLNDEACIANWWLNKIFVTGLPKIVVITSFTKCWFEVKWPSFQFNVPFDGQSWRMFH